MKLTIQTDRASQIVSGLDDGRVRLERYCTALRTLSARCAVSGRIYPLSIQRVADSLERESLLLRNMKNIAHSSIALYQSCEQNVAKCENSSVIDWGTVVKSDTAVAGGAVKQTEPFDWTMKDWAKLVGKAGIIGGVASSLMSVANEGISWKTGITVGKNLTGVVGKCVSAASEGTGAKWAEELFGLGTGLKKIDTSSMGKSFWSSIKKQFVDDLGLNGATKTADKIKAGTKWAGHFLTIAGNAVENYEEMRAEHHSVERMVSETVIESGVDIAIGAVATAASTAALGAISTAVAGTAAAALAPVLGSAVVIGAGAVAITWAANGVCKMFTGKNIKETVSDFVCDKVAPAVSEAVGNAVEVTGKAVEKVTSTVKKSVEKVAESFQSAVSSKWSCICSVFS